MTLESYIVQQTDYYPYGLTARNYVRAGEKETLDLFQGKTYEQLTGWHDFHARQYDAALGRWFGMDPQNQFASPYLAMGNNPVMMVDPDGELAWFVLPVIIGAVTGGINVAQDWSAIQAAGGGWGSFGVAAASFGIGFAAGAGATLGAAAAAPALTAAWGTGAASGAALGAIGGGISGFTIGAGNTWANGGGFLNGLGAGLIGAGTGTLVGGVTGGTFSGVTSLIQGNNFWTGVPKAGTGPNYSGYKLKVERPKLGSNLPQRNLKGLDNVISRNNIIENADDLLNSNIGSGDFANLGHKEFTKSNFRNNLVNLTGGVNPGSNFHAHHVIPHEFADKAIKLGINVNNPANAMWLHKTIHSQIHSQGYNVAWRQFFGTNPRSAQDVFNFGQKVLERYKIY